MVKLKSAVLTLGFTASTFLASCSTDTEFAAAKEIIETKKKKEVVAPEQVVVDSGQAVVAPEQADVSVKVESTGEFFKKGQSLDLYVVMDKSGSLWDSFGIRGSDPECLRLNALLDLVDGLRGQLNQNEEVRLNVITFGTKATRVGNISDSLSMTREDLDARLRKPICDLPPLFDSSTIYSSALELISVELGEQRDIKKLDVETAIFFSDGAAKDSSERVLKESIAKFNESFPQRAFGVLLGKTADRCNLKSDTDERLSAIDCIREVVGGDPTRVVQSANAAKLSETMIQLLKK